MIKCAKFREDTKEWVAEFEAKIKKGQMNLLWFCSEQAFCWLFTLSVPWDTVIKMPCYLYMYLSIEETYMGADILWARCLHIMFYIAFDYTVRMWLDTSSFWLIWDTSQWAYAIMIHEWKYAWCLCMLLLARVLIFQTSYFADISHMPLVNAHEIFSQYDLYFSTGSHFAQNLKMALPSLSLNLEAQYHT